MHFPLSLLLELTQIQILTGAIGSLGAHILTRLANQSQVSLLPCPRQLLNCSQTASSLHCLCKEARTFRLRTTGEDHLPPCRSKQGEPRLG